MSFTPTTKIERRSGPISILLQDSGGSSVPEWVSEDFSAREIISEDFSVREIILEDFSATD